ncbi:MAG: hypothetical protein FJX65_04330 [Alphaproteobacteria bacterium]|nr:hypothetical protein [Alphaproteobacteria bacterium]
MQRVLPFVPVLLPFLAYAVWVFIGRKKENGPSWHDAPWVTLSMIALALLIASLVATIFFEGSKPGTPYEPARMEDGRVVSPGSR